MAVIRPPGGPDFGLQPNLAIVLSDLRVPCICPTHVPRLIVEYTYTQYTSMTIIPRSSVPYSMGVVALSAIQRSRICLDFA